MVPKPPLIWRRTNPSLQNPTIVSCLASGHEVKPHYFSETLHIRSPIMSATITKSDPFGLHSANTPLRLPGVASSD